MYSRPTSDDVWLSFTAFIIHTAFVLFEVPTILILSVSPFM